MSGRQKRPMYRTRGSQLRDVEGFDESYYDAVSRKWRVRCSRCEAAVINGVAAHERGCSNQKKQEKTC